MIDKYIEYPLDKKYFEKINDLTSINLVIVGRDPYPKNPIKIPFMKSQWKELDTKSSGYHLINSLYGFKKAKEKFSTPTEFSIFILSKGVVFLNCTYHYLDKERFSKKKHSKFCQLALKININILEKSNKIFLCGDAKNMLELAEIENLKDKTTAIPHPALQSRNKIKDKNYWDKYWQLNSLSKLI